MRYDLEICPGPVANCAQAGRALTGAQPLLAVGLKSVKFHHGITWWSGKPTPDLVPPPPALWMLSFKLLVIGCITFGSFGSGAGICLG